MGVKQASLIVSSRTLLPDAVVIAYETTDLLYDESSMEASMSHEVV